MENFLIITKNRRINEFICWKKHINFLRRAAKWVLLSRYWKNSQKFL